MEPKIICFSPTGGGEKIAKAIRQGLSCNGIDNMEPYIFVIPVYGGHMPKIAKERFGNVHGTDSRPAILVAVYGNRAFENALVELEAFVRGHGFNPIAAGAFVCEHSYSTAETPIAAGRPDTDDLKDAEAFGISVKEKILAGDLTPINAADLQDEPSPETSVKNFSSFIKEYMRQQEDNPRTYIPELDKDLCSGCGTCIEACPAEAIREDFSIDASRCVLCCACVKSCPANARSFKSPFARPLSENFSVRKSPRWILNSFL